MFDFQVSDHGDVASTRDWAPAPGRRTLTASLPARRGAAPSMPASATPPPVQRAALDAPFELHRESAPPAAIAARGLAGAPCALPHGDAIQRAFGSHDVSRIPAFVGGPAADAAAALGARAYATDGAVAFASTPDLHTAAHEAAHVVQQRGGVQLAGGVGARGDRYEAHADRVADAVVAGRSAVAILDELAGSGGASAAVVQRADATSAAPTSAAGQPAGDVTGQPVEGDELVLPDLGAIAISVVARSIKTVAGQRGDKTEVKCAIRFPTEVPGLWLSGKGALSWDNAASGYSVGMSGGLGVAVGGPGAFADLLATLAVKGTGPDPESAARMLFLAIEETVRLLGDAVFMGGRTPAMALVIMLGRKFGVTPANLLADLIWGRGHAEQVKAAMQDGEAAQFDVGAELGGEAGKSADGSVEGGAGVVERHKIEKKPGHETTERDVAVLVVAAKVGLEPFEGSFKLEADLKTGGGAKLEMTLGARAIGADLGEWSRFVAAATQAFVHVRDVLTAKAPTSGEGAAEAERLARDLAGWGRAAGTALDGAVDLVAHGLEEHGVSKAKTTIGLEGAFRIDLAKQVGDLVVSLVDGGELAIPGGEGKAGYKQKSALVDVPFALG